MSFNRFAVSSFATVFVALLAACGQQTTLQPQVLLEESHAAPETLKVMALPAPGTVVGWGNNSFGQATVPAGLSNVTAITAGRFHSLALKSDGTVVGWGYNGDGEVSIPAGLSNVTAITAGSLYSLALKSDGTVVGWGDNSSGQVTVPAGLSNVIAITAGSIHSLALKSDGTVVGWGNNSSGQTTVPAGLSNVIAITAGNFHSLALKSDGTVVGWGNNSSGQAIVPAGLSNVIAIAGGGSHNLALVPSDTTAPVITPTITGTLGNNGWYTSDVNLTWTVTDTESAISSQTGCGPSSVTADTTGVTFTCTASSAGGTSTQSVTIKRDATAPTIAFVSRTAANSAGWNNTDVIVNWNCTDATSGAVTASVSQTLSSEGSNQSSSGTCTDNAGNSASDTQSGIKIDKTAPTLNPVVTPNPVLLNASASVVSNASDALSGLASQSCGALITSSVGPKSVSCNATDNAGNSSSKSAAYSVIYNFTGFFAPVQNAPALNTREAGSEIPFKFSLGGRFGKTVLSSLTSVQINCTSLAIIGSATALTRGELEFDDGKYKLEVKTDKAWKNSCRQITLTLNDGTTHTANFKFK